VAGANISFPTLPALWTTGILLVAAPASKLFERRPNSRNSTVSVLMILAAFFSLGVYLINANPPTPANPGGNMEDVNAAYKAIVRQVDRSLSPGDAGLFLAIVFGDQNHVDFDRREIFRRAGLLHIFAASGFNVTLAAAFIMLAARLARAPKLVAGALGLTSIGGYFWLVGPSPSVSRAAVMAAILYLALFFGRRVDSLASASAAALIMLAADPRGLFDLGWQLSFASLLGILVIYPWLSRFFEPRVEVLVAPITVTLSAQIGVAPILLYYFGQISTVAVLANPVVTATVGLITGIGFVSSLMSLAWGAPGRAIIAALTPFLRFVDGSAHFFASLPAATLQFEPSATIAMIFICIVVCAALMLRRHLGMITLPILVIFIIGLQAGGIWVDLAAGARRTAFSADFLDVGEGDATLIRARKGGVILVDGGEDYRVLDRDLRKRGVRKIDLLILSHPHADHVGALDDLIRNYPIGEIIESGFKNPTRAYGDFKAAARERSVPVDRTRAGQRYRVGVIDVKILWPGRRFIRGTDSDINNNSVVAKVSYGKCSLLMVGDIQLEAIERLTSSAADLSADVLKVSHQGSNNGTTVNWLRRIRPKYAVISVGKNNPYGHPHRAALSRLRHYVARVARTDRDGDIYVGADKTHIIFMR
jgi:competence protein ComEC